MILNSHQFLPFYYIFFVIAFTERFSNTFVNKNTKPTAFICHKWSFTILFISYVAILIASIVELFAINKSVDLLITVLGFVLYLIGVFLRRSAIKALNDNWSIHIEIKKYHNFVNNNIYGVMKHPYYMAVLLELSGICLIANSYFSLLGVYIIQAPLLFIRIKLEEKVLSDHLDGYKSYLLK